MERNYLDEFLNDSSLSFEQRLKVLQLQQQQQLSLQQLQQ
jgi:hypothetical protein